jgi:glycosyltransferase involved in cell wall biosynthesis
MHISGHSHKVTIILPVLNGAKTLFSAVKSVVDQDYEDWELLILDDGSSDGCIERLQNIKDPRIHIYVDGIRKGLAVRLNEGIDLSSGKYIARMDADDICFPARLSSQVSYLETHPDIDLIACKTVAFYRSGENLVTHIMPYLQMHDELTSTPWRGIYLPHPSWMGASKWFRKHRYLIPEVFRAEDQELLLRAMPESHYYCLPEILLAYRLGEYDLRKSLYVRKQLLKVQVNIFFKRRQWIYILRTTYFALLRVIFDLVRLTLPIKTWSTLKVKSQVTPELQYQLIALIDKCEK